MNLNTDAFRRSAPWIIAAAAPVVGYVIYRNLSPRQKTKFKKSLTEGTLAFTSALITRAINSYKNRSAQGKAISSIGEKPFVRMASIPNSDESETTIGNEKW